ncbi:MAG: tRNA-guanine transglycosylase [Ottowia sp.]|nr:tRNA-guanine transglycosylase [Ottowia sp.]
MTVKTARGDVRMPAYLPVTTFGDSFPLDRLIQPFLPRFADMLMVSYAYAKSITKRPEMPLFIDSGGFACLLDGYRVICREDGTGCIVGPSPTTDENKDNNQEGQAADMRGTTADSGGPGEVISPEGVLELQNRLADFASTLDFPIPPSLDAVRERKLRLDLTLANARYAIDAKVDASRLFGSVQGFDLDTYTSSAESLVSMGFSDLAIGGMVPRARDKAFVLQVCRRVADVLPEGGLLHVFGIGDPSFVAALFAAGATSIDSSSYVQSAVSGKQWDGEAAMQDPSPLERAHAALRNLKFATEYLGV